MKKLIRVIRITSHFAIVLIAILLSIITIRLFYAAPPNPVLSNSTSRIPVVAGQPTSVGKTVPIKDIDWTVSKKTLVLYISTTCHFCNESSPFYKRIAEAFSASKDVRLVAVMPQSIQEAKTHLRSLGVGINDVFNERLDSIGISATPTLLLVDEFGVVSERWVGKLPADKEIDVFNKLSS